MIEINFDQIFNNWIKQELDHRKKEGLIDKDFRYSKCLITFPKNSKPIVKFNKEIQFSCKAKVSLKEDKVKGDPVYIDEFSDIVDVELPNENGELLAFIYLQFNGNYSEGALFDIVFDFSPNQPQLGSEKEQISELTRKTLVKLIRKEFKEKVIAYVMKFKDILMENGLWVIPALLPTPLNKIIVAIQNNNLSEANELILNHCSDEFLESLIKNWWNIKEFIERKSIIEEAFFCYNNERHISAISTLLPHLEGIITEFGHSETGDMPWRQESKTKKVKEVLSKISFRTYEFESILYFTFSFLIDGPMLETFKDWAQKVKIEFPNRNVVSHGKYIKELYTKENSIKVFLLLDTICWIIREYRKVNVIEHQEITRKLHKINFLDSQGKIEDALNEVEEILAHPKFTLKYDFFCQAINYKIVLLNELNKLDKALELFEIFDIKEISEIDLNSFNTKSLILAKKGEYDEAHSIVDNIIEKTKNEIERLNYTDSKGEIFQIEGKFQEAIEIYEEIIKRVKEDFNPKIFIYFTHITHIKLGMCYKEIGDKEKAIIHLEEGKKLAKQRNLKKWIKRSEELLSKSI